MNEERSYINLPGGGTISKGYSFTILPDGKIRAQVNGKSPEGKWIRKTFTRATMDEIEEAVNGYREMKLAAQK